MSVEYHESFEPTPFAVECPEHGIVYLTAEAYAIQLEHPDDYWFCPRMESEPPGMCGEPSEFSDTIYEAAFED